VVTVCFSSRTSDPGVYGSRGRGLVDHSIGTAYMARLLAHEVDVDAEQAYLYGLMHDFGKLVILKLAADFGRRTGSPVPADELDEALLRHHAGVGAFALRRWSLPDGLDEPVMCHHNYPAAQVAPREAMVAYLANRLSHRYGFGCDPEPYDMTADPAFAALGLTAAWLASTDDRAPGLYVVANSFLHGGGRAVA
jgi:putative nucleotidyltransferase with HDIG domain